MAEKYAYLICVQADNKETGESQNNNKFYEMKENGDGTFTATYGRVGNSPATKEYPISNWDKVYNAKTKKIRNGYIYKDITELRVVKESVGFSDVQVKSVKKLLDTLMKYSKQSISENYTVSSEAVTKEQIDKAQELVDEVSILVMKRSPNLHKINELLLELYTTIPRAMKRVSDYLLNDDVDKSEMRKLIANEQDTLDVMAQQVSLNTSDTDDGEKQTLIEAMGLEVFEITDKEIEEIKKLMGPNVDQFKEAWRVVNKSTSEKFDKQRKKSYKPWTKLLWHGSRNENWLNIIKTGLLIRPAGVVLTGAMFGSGLYMADKAQKSIGYTSLKGSYWARGYNGQAFLALYAVNTGLELRKQKHESWMYDLNYNNLQKHGEYDSLFAEGGIDLRNNEYIIYKPEQCTIKYIVEIGD